MKKKIIFILLTIIMVIPMMSYVVFADDISTNTVAGGKCGTNASWALDSEGGLTISGNGEMNDYNHTTSKAPWNKYKSQITTLIVEDGITSIGEYAFYDCSNVTSITISESVKEIGVFAFCRCTSLKRAIIPENVESIDGYIFSGCENLTSVTLPSIVKMFGPGVFRDCTKLSSVKLPNGVTVIDYDTFSGCENLVSVTIPNSVTKIKSAFENCKSIINISLPESVTEIGYNSFYGCESLTNINIPNSVTSIGSNTFYGCTSLTSVDIPESVVKIGEGAFSGCENLTNVNIPEGITSISADTFKGCKNITNIEIPEGVTSIGDYAFDYCASLGEINIPSSVTTIGSYAFSDCYKFKNIEIPEGVTSIGDYAFSYCTGLTNIDIPESVTVIGKYAFTKCTNLKNVTIEKGFKEIGDYAFNQCTNLVSVSVPEEGMSIGKYAFQECSSLTDIERIASVNSYAFYNCKNLKSVTFLDGSRSISDHAFSGCSSLTDVVIPGKLGYIGKSAFWECENLKDIDTPNSIGPIYEYAFYNCKSIKNINIAEGVSFIYDHTFKGCESLETVTIPESVTDIKEYAFYGCSSLKEINIPKDIEVINEYVFYGCSSLKDVTFGEYVTEFGGLAFYGCSSIENIVIPDGALKIGGGVFGNCTNLRSITIPDSVTSIASSALNGSDNVTVKANPNTHAHKFATNNNIRFSCITHDEVETPSVPATCTKPGSTEGTHCSVCNEIITAQVEIPALGHVAKDGEITTPPTCTERGYTTYECSVCGDTYVEDYVAASGHDMTYHAAVAAECEKDGNIEHYTCGVCKGYFLDKAGAEGATADTVVEPATKHDYETTITPPTCTERGYTTYECSVCGDTYVEDYVAASGHDMTYHAAIAAGCEKAGNIEHYTCGVCKGCFLDEAGKTVTTAEKTVVPATKHNYEAVVTVPTCTEAGYTTYTCNCGDTYTADKKAATDHTKVTDKAVAATYFKTGLTAGSHCKVCKKVLVKQKTVAKKVYTAVPKTAAANLSTAKNGYDNVKFSWSKVTGATGYKVYYKKATASKWSGPVAVKGKTYYTTKNLTAGTKYSFKVVPYIKSGAKVVDSKKYKSASVYTLKKISTPKVVKSGTKVKVSWTNINGETGYQISQSTKKTGTKVVSTYKTTTGKAKLITAKKGVKYYYKVRAYKNVKVGSKTYKVYGPWSGVKLYKR